MLEWEGAQESVYRLAAGLPCRPLTVRLRLKTTEPTETRPAFTAVTDLERVTVQVESAGAHGFDILLAVEDEITREQEREIRLLPDHASTAGIPECRVIVRWVACRIDASLILRQSGARPIKPQTHAALLWHSYGRYSELVGLKRFHYGMSGSDVLVFRPRLRNPQTGRRDYVGRDTLDIASGAWGACLLVKTGPCSRVSEEWERFQVFLVDRVHPFMSRCEALITAQRPGTPPEQADQATLIGTFLGGDLLHAEPLQAVLRDKARQADIPVLLSRVYSTAAAWYAGDATAPLGQWWKMLPPVEEGKPGIKLFGRFNLEDEADRQRFTAPLMWDIAFAKREHLVNHLLGKARDGLLYRLLDLPLRYSVIHGDLQPRNILTDERDIWLIDFGQTCIAPTLYDFTKLEVHLRLWCLDLASTGDSEDQIVQMESLLLDNFTATEAGIEPIARLAEGIGAEAGDLQRIARGIMAIRRLALPYFCDERPDRREYLVVLYLTVLNMLRYAGGDTAPITHFRWLMGLYWALEDALSRMVGLEPFARGRIAVQHERLLTPQWLAGRHAPRRILYWLDRADGQRALALLHNTRGVLQGTVHHLDVCDHTLLVLAYLEAILEDPVAGLLHPGKLDDRVEADLREQGISLPPVCDFWPKPAAADAEWLAPFLPELNTKLADYLNEERRLLVKWTALFHDVGKPATRVMTPDPATGAVKTQFLGHEVYGMRLAAPYLDTLFPASEQNRPSRESLTVQDMIRRHHLHHTQATRYNGMPAAVRAVRECVAQTEQITLAVSEQKYLYPLLDERQDPYAATYPLLILHGYADLLACRGPARLLALEEVASIDLALLALYFLRYPALQHRQAMEAEFAERTRGFGEEPAVLASGGSGRRLGDALRRAKERFMEAACPPDGAVDAESAPSREQLLEWVCAELAAGSAG